MGVTTLDVTRYNGIEVSRAGGSCTNILRHLAYMGWDCTMCHMDGNDKVSEYLKNDLKESGVKSVSLRHDIPSYVLIINSKNGQHVYGRTCEHGKQTASCKIVVPSLEEKLDPDCDIFIFDKAWDAAARFAERTSGMVWFETYKRGSGSDIWNRCAGLADIIKSADDVTIPDGTDRIVTHGADGLEYRYSGVSGKINGLAVPSMADACGCGDCVSACCIDAICRGESMRAGLERGVRLATLNCCYPGPQCMVDSTTAQYRNEIINGRPITSLPKAVYKTTDLNICSCDKK